MSREADLFAEALALPAPQRVAYLDRVCGGDALLRGRLVELIASHEEAKSFMQSPTVPECAVMREEAPGDVIGRYKLLQKIGEGGCGVVYMAEQEEPVRRRVALKVIKLGMDTKEVIARFEAERQAVALMDHANIAKVFDAGATETGRPYFVMELVRGVKITDYCDQNNLPTAERLKLFAQVCRAIQHAHQKGIIHRDIKPSNILVTLHDGVAVPKVIDFGIAKATQGRLTDATVFTAFEQFIGTPAYMSPEQAEMSGLDIDTRSDIYSLGVLLYELLTGRTPFDTKALLQQGLDAIRRHIREVDPPKPSTRLSTMEGEALTTTARLRQTEPPKLMSLVRGDLDWIVMRCLEKDRTRRYETANGLADDLVKHLQNQPVSACPPSSAYLLSKFVRRHRVGFAAGAMIAATIVIGAGVATWQAVRATRAEKLAEAQRDAAQHAREQETRIRELAERRREETEAARQSEAAARQLAERRRIEADEINRFMISDVFGGVSPEVAQGRDITAHELLGNAASRVAASFTNDPQLEASIRKAIGEAYTKISLFERADAHLQSAWETRRRLLGEDHPDTLLALRSLTLIKRHQRKFDEAEQDLEKVRAAQERVIGADDPETMETLAEIMDVRLMRLDLARPPAERRPLLDAALEMARQNHARALTRFGPDDRRILRHVGNLLGAVMYNTNSSSSMADATAAEKLGAGAIATYHRIVGPDHPETLENTIPYLILLGTIGRSAEATRGWHDLLARQERVLGPEHHLTGVTMHHIAIGHLNAGRLPEACRILKRFVAGIIKIHGWNSPQTRSFLHEFGLVLPRAGQPEEALAFAQERMEEAMRAAGPESPGVSGLRYILGNAYLALGRAAEAEPMFRACMDYVQKNPKSWSPEGLLGEALLAQGKFVEAEPLVVTGFEDKWKRITGGFGLGWTRSLLWEDYSRVVRLYTEWGRPEQAAEWRKREADVSRLSGRRSFHPLPVNVNVSARGPANFTFDVPRSAVAPVENLPGWTRYGANHARYSYSIGEAQPDGQRVLQIGSDSAQPKDSVWFRQNFSAEKYAGRRARLRVEMKSENVTEYARISWGMSRGDGADLAGSERQWLGTSDWREQSIVFDVPRFASVIRVLLSLQGPGTIWLRNLKFEEVGEDVPPDNTLAQLVAPPAMVELAKAPANLSFTDPTDAARLLATGVPPGWRDGNDSLALYRVSLDRENVRTKPVSLHVRSNDREMSSQGSLVQTFSAENFRNRRVRFTGWIKTEAIERSVRLFLRVDKRPGEIIHFANMISRAPKGTTDWTEHAVVLDVPPESNQLVIAVIVSGGGEAWFNDLRFEVVGEDVPTTAGSK